MLFTAYAIVRTVPSANRPNRRKKNKNVRSFKAVWIDKGWTYNSRVLLGSFSGPFRVLICSGRVPSGPPRVLHVLVQPGRVLGPHWDPNLLFVDILFSIQRLLAFARIYLFKQHSFLFAVDTKVLYKYWGGPLLGVQKANVFAARK